MLLSLSASAKPGAKSGDPALGHVVVGQSTTQPASVCAICVSGDCEPPDNYVTVDSINVDAPFTLADDACTGTSVTVGSCCTVQVGFTAGAAGAAHGSITFNMSHSVNSTVVEPLSAIGTSTQSSNSANSCMSQSSSSVNIDTLALNETIPLVGVPFSLNYSSGRLSPVFYRSPVTLGLGGWTPSILHGYDTVEETVYFGDGGARPVTALSNATGYFLSSQDGTEVYDFDSTGLHLHTRDSVTGAVKYKFAYSNGKIATISDGFGNMTQFSYSGSTIKMTSPYGQISKMSLDSQGFLAAVTNPNNESYHPTHSSAGLLTAFQKPMGNTSHVTYDSDGFVLKDQGAGGDFLSFTRTFDTANHQQTVVQKTALNRQTTFISGLNPLNSFHTTIAPEQSFNQTFSQDVGLNFAVDAYGQVINQISDVDPRFGEMAPYPTKTEFTVPNSPIDLKTSTTRYAYLTDQTDPMSHYYLISTTSIQNDPTRTFSTSFDRASGTFAAVSPMGRYSYQVIAPNSLVSMIQTGTLASVNFLYDSRGRVVSIKQLDRENKLSYDSHGNVASIKDAIGRIVNYQYDNANRLTYTTLPDHNAVFRAYDANGDLLLLTPPGRPAHKFTYNLMELAASYLPPSISASMTGATNFSYNLDRQLTQISRSDGMQVKFNYDIATGLLNSVTTPLGNYNLTYMANSNLTSSISSPDNEVISYSYAGSTPTQISTSGAVSSTVNFSFNADGTLSQIKVAGASGPQSVIDRAYDNDGLLVRTGDETLYRNEFGAVAGTSLTKTTGTLLYDSTGQLVAETILSGKSKVFQRKLTRDKLGRIVKIVENIDHDTDRDVFTYDLQGHLTEVLDRGEGHRFYKYDQNGNRIEKRGTRGVLTADYDNQDRLTRYGKAEYRYSANGDLAVKIEKELDRDNWGCFLGRERKDVQETDYSYDVFGNLQSVQLPDRIKVEYIVDGQNRRVGKKINGKLVQGFVYQSQNQVAAELDGQGRIVKRFVYGSKANVPDYMIMDLKTYRIMSDQLGTPRLVVDAGTGKIVEYLEFDEFGIPQEMAGKSLLPFGFAGGLFDRDTGLVRMGARDYDPVIGRWISKDPTGFGGGDTNLYSYAGQDPVNGIDPLGLYTEIVGWNGVGSGSSSFGHISVNINGTSYSFGPGGLDIRPFNDYLSINNFRDGAGIILDLTPAQEATFASYLKVNSNNYNAVTNNCGNPVQSGLVQLGVLSGGNNILPNNVFSAISSSQQAIGQASHPANPINASPNSPWGHIQSP